VSRKSSASPRARDRILSQLPDVPELSEIEKARIRQAVLSRRRVSPRSGRLLAALGAVALAGGLVLALHLQRARVRAIAWSAEAGTSRALPTTDDIEATLVGPARAELVDGVIRLRAGQLSVRTQERAQTIEAEGGRIIVRPRSLVEVRTVPRLQVATYAGSALAQWTGSTTVVELRPLATAPRAPSPSDENSAPPSPPPPPSPARPSRPASKHAPPTRPPELRIAPPLAPAPRAGDPAAPASTTTDGEALREQSRLLAEALVALRERRRPEEALAQLDELARRYPTSALGPEAQLIRVDCALALGQRSLALALLDRMTLAHQPRATELLVVRGELRAEQGRCDEAVADAALALTHATGALADRAQRLQSLCHGRAR
jgi:hypothetical protein